MGFASATTFRTACAWVSSVHEVRFYRAQMDYTVVRDGSGAIGLISDDSEIVRGLVDGGPRGLWDAPGPWDYGVAIRHVDAPTFHTTTGEARWRLHPSLDLGAAAWPPQAAGTSWLST